MRNGRSVLAARHGDRYRRMTNGRLHRTDWAFSLCDNTGWSLGLVLQSIVHDAFERQPSVEASRAALRDAARAVDAYW